MPILEVHLVEGAHPAERFGALLTALSSRYAEVLESPPERVRVHLALHDPEHWITGGTIGRSAPYFTALMLEGRPTAQRQQLLAELTDVLVDVLDVERDLVRGRVVPVHPDDWGIGGVPASVARRDEIAARARDR